MVICQPASHPNKQYYYLSRNTRDWSLALVAVIFAVKIFEEWGGHRCSALWWCSRIHGQIFKTLNKRSILKNSGVIESCTQEHALRGL